MENGKQSFVDSTTKTFNNPNTKSFKTPTGAGADSQNDRTTSKQILTLQDRKNLTITGVGKMISVKPDLLQLSTNMGNLQIVGVNMEMTKLDLDQKIVEVAGIVNQIRFLDDKKQPLFKRIFK